MRRLTITHLTTYRYSEPVAFGPHRMLLRPRDSHELRVHSATLVTSLPAELVWTYDIFGNVVCTAHFEGETRELAIESRLELPLLRHLNVAPYARLFVFEGRAPQTEHVAASYLLGLSF